ncbi:hypothetical protein [Amycolatopsis sp. H20-H5]|uniref:hypothetical protein n=1 Tax=Amycolatopsis sp. H20-H5 TaxID=3046309 RepID=UPI002DBFBAE8|nr:hypothetical protein [Amycolatopsis sp. H20-H5]MEC3981524.1 hypothetical protein [Amycolatopsis sp. H20-H5]
MPSTSDAVGERLAALFRAWRQDILAVPMPSLIDPVRAVDVVIGTGTGTAWTGRVHAPPDGACTRSRDLDSEKDVL